MWRCRGPRDSERLAVSVRPDQPHGLSCLTLSAATALLAARGETCSGKVTVTVGCHPLARRRDARIGRRLVARPVRGRACCGIVFWHFAPRNPPHAVPHGSLAACEFWKFWTACADTASQPFGRAEERTRAHGAIILESAVRQGDGTKRTSVGYRRGACRGGGCRRRWGGGAGAPGAASGSAALAGESGTGPFSLGIPEWLRLRRSGGVAAEYLTAADCQRETHPSGNGTSCLAAYASPAGSSANGWVQPSLTIATATSPGHLRWC